MSHTDLPVDDRPVEGRVARIIEQVLEPRVLGPLVGAAMVAIGLVVVHEITGALHLDQISAAIRQTSVAAVWQSIAFTLISFVAMSVYDIMAVRRVAPDKVPVGLAAFAGFVGYGISNAIGFHVFVGGPVRYRIYQTAGLDFADVGRVVGISFLTFSAGILTTVGLALLIDPFGIPWMRLLSALDDRLIGVAILVFLAAALVWLARGNHQVTLLGWRFPLPTARSAAAQIVVGAIDIAAAAAALYVLLPADLANSFSAFLILFVAAITAGVISHAPGGLGVIEATILFGLGAGTRPDAVAALVVFRLIYYIGPLALAGLALLAFEAYRARASVAAVTSLSFAVTRRLVPPVAATLVFVGGLVLLLSGNLPAQGERTDFLSDILPLPFAEASHLLASLVGLVLIVLARGLYRRIALARLVSIILLLAGAAFSLLKGLDWEEATILTVIAGLLYFYGSAFYRKSDWRAFRPNATWLAMIVIVLASITLVGLLAYRHVDYDNDLWWQFAWDGDAPRFLRATLALVIVAAVIATDSLVNRPHQPKVGKVDIPDAVRRVLDTCAGTQPCVALLGDKSFMVSTSEKAFLMYAVSGRSWITMGDPVGDEKSCRALVWRFAETADRAGARAVFYGVAPEALANYLDLGLAILKIGENARVPLADFTLAGPVRQPFRYAHGKATREGLVFSVVDKSEVPALLPELRAVSDEWMANKVGTEKGFSLGRFEDEYMKEFDCALLTKDGVIVAFANLWRAGDGDELSVDLMRYRPGVSKVMMEALFSHILLYGRDQGYKWFNLGAAPLAGLADHPLASTWSRVGTFIYRRGDEFYNFEGLRAFKQKFDPVWTPQYMACPGGLAMPQVLLDVTTLISGSPMRILKR